MGTDPIIRKLQRRLEAWELGHLRQLASDLAERLEQAEEEAARANESAEFWERHAMQLQEALNDEGFATHRSIGITQGGELLVVRNEPT